MSEGIDKERRDLYAVSLALLLYRVAGGTFDPDKPANTILGPVHFDRPSMLLIAAWVVWAYFLWRFLQKLKDPVKQFSREVRTRATGTGLYRWLSRQEAEALIQRLDYYSLNLGLARAGGMVEENTHTGWLDDTKRAINEALNAKLVFHCSPWCSVMDLRQVRDAGNDAGHQNIHRHESIRAHMKFSLPWQYQVRILATAIPSAALRNETFGEQLLPLVVAALTVAAWLFVPGSLVP